MSDTPKDHRSTPPSDGCTWFRLRRTARRVTQIYDRHLAPAGLRVTQWSLLATLNGLPPSPLGAIAGAMGMDRTTLSRNMLPLQRAGYVETRVGEDRRRKTLALTSDGRALVRRAFPLWRDAERELRATLGPATTERLRDALDESMRRISEAGATS